MMKMNPRAAVLLTACLAMLLKVSTVLLSVASEKFSSLESLQTILGLCGLVRAFTPVGIVTLQPELLGKVLCGGASLPMAVVGHSTV